MRIMSLDVGIRINVKFQLSHEVASLILRAMLVSPEQRQLKRGSRQQAIPEMIFKTPLDIGD